MENDWGEGCELDMMYRMNKWIDGRLVGWKRKSKKWNIRVSITSLVCSSWRWRVCVDKLLKKHYEQMSWLRSPPSLQADKAHRWRWTTSQRGDNSFVHTHCENNMHNKWRRINGSCRCGASFSFRLPFSHDISIRSPSLPVITALDPFRTIAISHLAITCQVKAQFFC